MVKTMLGLLISLCGIFFLAARMGKRSRLRREQDLAFVKRQIESAQQETEQLTEIATQCAQESAGRIDATRDHRMAGRSQGIRESREFLHRLLKKKERLEKELGYKEVS